MKLNSKELLSYQQFWKESKNLSQQHQIGLINLSNKLLERAKDYDGEIYFLIYFLHLNLKKR